MELAIINNNQVLSIDNFEAYKTELEKDLQKYKGYVLVDTKTAKEDRAFLNKLKDAIDAERKKAKKEIEKIYKTTLEPQVKELLAMIEACAVEIDNQIKNEEEKFKIERQKEIDEIVAKTIGKETYERIHARETKRGLGNTLKWLNKSTSIQQIERDIEDIEYNLKNEKKSEYYLSLMVNASEKEKINKFLTENGIQWQQVIFELNESLADPF